MAERWWRAMRPVGWLVVLGCATSVFHRLGDGPLAAPPLVPAGWLAWLAGRDPLLASVALLRLVLLAACWYLLLALVAGLLARLSRLPRLIRATDALSPPAVRRMLSRSLGVSLATVLVAGGLPATSVVARAAPGELATSTPVDAATAGGPLAAGPGGDASLPLPLELLGATDPTGMRELDEPTPGSDGRGPATPADPRPSGEVAWADRAPTTGRSRAPARATAGGGPAVPAADAPEASVGTPAPGGSSRVVVAGDSFWSLAVETLMAGWGRTPSDREVVGYWRALIASNRDQLDDPDDPDLIFPGQRFDLPPVPMRPDR
jgi:nucleoid-associated protein YgaU